MEKNSDLRTFPSARGLDDLITLLWKEGYHVIGPRHGSGVIQLGEIRTSSDLPRGMRDLQEKAYYRLETSNLNTFFGFNLGPTGWKNQLFPPERTLWQAKRGEDPKAPDEALNPIYPRAFLGVRACELAAIRVQDRILMGSDPEYARRRRNLFIVGVHCQKAVPTCFCPSMGTGPEFPESGWDLLLTEMESTFLVQSGSPLGEKILSSLNFAKAPNESSSWIQEQLESTRSQIKRTLPQEHIKEDIFKALKSSHWDDVGARCLGCANCTMVCPTCFCTAVTDSLDVTGEVAQRKETWDSCFHLDFTYMHGGNQRVSISSRYRQWFSHKLATWFDQFGTSGCVGCGRCISWCPVGIDLTAEMASIRDKNRTKDSEGFGR